MRRINWRTVVQSLVTAVAFASGTAQAGGPFPYTEEWYQMRASDPPGDRQVEKYGKMWPPFARPQGRRQTFHHAFYTAHYWPHPYDCQDRADVQTMIDAQTASGWALATTLHDYHFNTDTQQLNEGGRTQLLWVLNSVPPQYRVVYVAQGVTREMGQLRAASAEQFLAESATSNVPPVIVRAETFGGRPANEVDRLRNLDLNSIPRPRLFLIGAAAKSGSGGGGGSGGAGTGAGGSGTGSTSTR